MFRRTRRINKSAIIMAVPSVFFLLVGMFGFSAPAQATFSTATQISGTQAFLQGEFAEVGVRANGAFGSTSVPSGFHQNISNCLGFRVDRSSDGWGNSASTDDGDFFCPGSPFEGWQMKVGSNIAKNDHSQTGISGSVSDIQTAGSSQCVTWESASAYNGVSVSQRYCVPTAGQALHTDVTITNTTGSAITDVYFGRGFDPDNTTGTGPMTCNGATVNTNTFGSCNAVTGQGTEAQATARWGNGAFIALQSFDSRARVARQTGGFSSPDPSAIWTAGDTSATAGTYRGDVGEFYADAGLYVALKVPTLGAGASTSFRISYVLSAEGNNAPVVGAPIVSGIGQTSAHVAATVNPKGFATTVDLAYSTSSSFASSSIVSLGSASGSDEVSVEGDITGLDPSTTYYGKIIAENEKGTTESALFSFESLSATAPTVTSDDPTVSVDDGPVTLHGSFNPNGFSSTAAFEYGTTADFSGTVISIPISGTFTGTDSYNVSTTLSDLETSTTYYFRIKVTNASGTAYGSTISFVPADVPAPTSLVVTSLDDTTSSGTLRWAITQANGTSGGIYDSITFGVNGTITLASALPQISESVTITGSGRTNTIVDGDNSYRIFHVQSGRTLTVSNMTLKQGASTNGGLIYNGQGTVSATNIRFTAMSGGTAVWNNNGGSTATYTNCTFDNLNVGIGADYGSTPQLPSGETSWSGQSDSVFGNKTYVDNCVFDNNNSGIDSQRFTKVQNSTFTGNSYGANIQGLNRSQILDSTFDANGVAIYHNAWIPTSFNMGTDNRLIDGNEFTNNGIAMYLDDGYNNAHKNPGWSTVTDNTWDEEGVWITYYKWDGSTNVVGNLSVDEETDLFIHLRNTAVTPPTTTTTTTTVPVAEPTSTTTTTTEAPTPVTTTAPVIVAPVTTEPATTVPEESIPDTTVTLPEETTTTTIEEEPATTVAPKPTVPDTTVDTSVPDSTDVIVEIPPTVDLTDTAAVAEVLADVISSDTTPEELVAVVDAVLAEAVSPEEITAVLTAVFEQDLTAEQFSTLIDSVLESADTPEEVAAVIDALDSDSVTSDQVSEVVDKVLENGIDAEVATTLASSARVLQSIDGEQATEVFAAVEVSALTDEAGAQIVDAVQDAPTDVKEAFEEEINVFAGVFDTYVPLDSTINVGQRRTVIAVNLVASTVALGAGAGGLPSPSTGSKQNLAARKEDEDEEGGSIEGEGPEWIKQISIYKYIDGVKVMNWKNFFKKFTYGVMASGFTLAGATVMYFTLSGLTQQIALWGTVIAFACAMYLHMLEPDE